jgi:hypothetical protein
VFGDVLRTIGAVLALLGAPPDPATPTPNTRDDTATLQARLDAGEDLELPRLSDGSCYRTRGLWVSRGETVISSPDGACVEAIGPGDARLLSPDGDPITGSAIFRVSRSAAVDAEPVGVTIRNLRLVVPDGLGMMGILVAGNQVEIDRVRIEGAPVDALAITGRGTQQGVSEHVSIHDCAFVAGTRNVVSISSVRDVEIARTEISGATDTNLLAETGVASGNPAAGIDVEPNGVGEPIVDVRIHDNRIEGNAGPGILLALAPNDGLPTRAGPIEIARNRIVGNGTKPTPPLQGGIVVAGGQADGAGRLTIVGNEIRGNAGYGIGGHPKAGTTMIVDARANTIEGNAAGRIDFVRIGRGSHLE